MKKTTIIAGAVLLLMLANSLYAAQTDNPKCKDFTLFSKMPESWAYNCDERQFDAYNFATGKGKTTTVEGKFYKITFYPDAQAKQKPSELQMRRNYENAVQKIGGTIVGGDRNKETFKITKDGKEIWVELWTEFTGKYGFTVVQKEAMAQVVEANAQAFLSDIRATGHAAVYGIYFDTGKSAIKTESAQAIGEITKLLKSDPGLKVFVVGHTDNAGGVDSNIKLSQSRAEAVIQSLVREHGISAARLRGFGCGQFAPVTSNDSEDGRAKNRRVELVKQ
jgi:OmpA-OmpF porin, OOP family